ncbi:Alcohol oxidase [Daldinia childiae]|uniref:Alcohol oxidase n=1 Tax=Daldinia childiae TaxID=326645 RepID=UPI001447B14D|nr:Alcohol oxidase [Daldinia childiae]KAF3068910.1 Alcohol oxidase [Daldinia childiae]
MGLYTQLPDAIQEVDVIIAGGGTAGCIIASRLADADPNLSVLVIEGGPNNYNEPLIVHPAFFFSNLAPGTKTIAFKVGNKSEHLANRELVVPTANVLGGGSSVNFSLYSRAQRTDLDAWQTPGWSADELLPYMKKIETYHGADSKGLHGTDGPIIVSSGSYRATRIEDDFLNALKTVGYPEVEDMNDLDSCNGAQRAMRYVAPDGLRQDVAHSYLHPRLRDGKHPNLHVLVESKVIRLVLDNNRAVGVVYRPNSASSAAEDRTVKAKKQVILSAGAFGTPAILERSGVGNPEILKKAGVQPVVDLPGVGHGYEDHHIIGYPYRSSLNPDESHDSINGGRFNMDDPETRKLLGWNAADITCKLRPTESDVAALGLEFQKVWEKEWKHNANKPMAVMAAYNAFPGVPIGLPIAQYFGHNIFSPYPASRGHVHITGPDLDDKLDFESGFFADAGGNDIKKCRWAYKVQREIARRRTVYRGEVPRGHPAFAADSKAACIETEEPLPAPLANIEYTPEDDAVIDQFLRENVQTTWHSLGTCKLGKRENLGVVDADLNVYGVEALKIADLSIMPHNIGAHAANMAMVIGEKTADTIVRELGLAH